LGQFSVTLLEFVKQFTLVGGMGYYWWRIRQK
jgi:hypothetical protein